MRPSSAPAGGGGLHRRSRSLSDYHRGNITRTGLGESLSQGPGQRLASGLGLGLGLGLESESVIPVAVAAGTRPNLSIDLSRNVSISQSRDDSMLSYSRTNTTANNNNNNNNNITKSPGSSSRGAGGSGGGSSVVPLSRLRDVLSDAGVQLGSDDAARLEDIVRRDLLTHPRYTNNNNNIK